ncbi:pilus assembly protein [Burkholderia sp. WAC0059]|uniref:tetratricopeptide repeat protein n=1 Tax=Burkholderia sp. WAC0059 TaxID=2066022 RepID=UPI000C7E8950|nr:tetratricopeptide repeat protein [Burkholderia sp. WAC0059]PLZ03364.1 pilus assembly protein [Burkholderia sp. WAC0059]
MTHRTDTDTTEGTAPTTSAAPPASGANTRCPRLARPVQACALTGLLAGLLALGACASKETGYGVGSQAEREALIEEANRAPQPDTPGLYLELIERMQADGLYYASLAHLDAYEKQYGPTPKTILLRADALRATAQPAAASADYARLLQTPLAANGYHGLGLIAGANGDFGTAAARLAEAARRAPTDTAVLSDLGYALLREGDVDGARVPLMKAMELDHDNPKIVSNVTLFLLADGDRDKAQALMDAQQMSPTVRAAILADASKVVVAEASRPAAAPAPVPGPEPESATEPEPAPAPMPAQSNVQAPPLASTDATEPAPPLLQRFAQ